MRRLYCLWLLWLLILPARGAIITEVEPDPAFEDELITLTLLVDDVEEGTSLNTAPLETDFRVLATQTGSHLRLEDGKWHTKTRWVIHLRPRQRGILTIPALEVGSQRSQAREVTVVARPARTDQPDSQDLLLEVEAEPRNPYVQQQVRLTVRVLTARPMIRGAISDPQADNALIQTVGSDQSYQTSRNGQSYRVIERHYALFPERSGDLVIPAIRFEGRLAEDPNGPYLGRFHTAHQTSEPLVLEVRPRPQDYPGRHWLPAESLELRESWPQEPPRFQVGEPVTRTLILQARGLTSAQLPQLEVPTVEGLRLYPDQPSQENREDGPWLVGRQEQRLAVVPARPGELLLPEIQLTWWDVSADQARTAVLPARTIQVAAAPGAPAQAEAPGPATEPGIEPPPQRPFALARPQGLTWPGIAAGLLILWLATLWAWWRARQRPTAADPARPGPAPDPTQARADLELACREDDPGAAAAALGAWGRARWPGNPPGGPVALARRLGTRTGPFAQLDRALYAPGAPDAGWKGEDLWRAFETAPEVQTKPADSPDGLPPLYPPPLRPIE